MGKVKTVEKTAGKLKDLIDKNGPGYLAEEPYQVYTELIGSDAADNKTAGAILCCLLSGIAEETRVDRDLEGLSKVIQKECCFNKKMANHLAEIFLVLYSDGNKDGWKQKDMEGFTAFLKEEFTCAWEGFSVWDAGNGTVDCHYEAEIILSPTADAAKDAELAGLIKKNPFITKEAIHNHFEEKIGKYLDDEFEDYCTCDDYYQPVVEDFEIEYRVTEWSRKNGFEVVSCNGDGGDDGYEPKFRRGGWY